MMPQVVRALRVSSSVFIVVASFLGLTGCSKPVSEPAKPIAKPAPRDSEPPKSDRGPDAGGSDVTAANPSGRFEDRAVELGITFRKIGRASCRERVEVRAVAAAVN